MQLVVISGKGGTGKTTVAACFSYLNEMGTNIDCDVDASNLHMMLGGKDVESNLFIGAKVAHINMEKCTQCGACENVCRFDAISNFEIDELKCEGCAACSVVCMFDAISLADEVTGNTIITQTDKGILSRAEMKPGAEGSGKLVTEVRKNALKYKVEDKWTILDGSPGVGCAVMASVAGCNAALLVVEPTQSGLEDFVRVLSVVDFFDIKPFVCINKYDINEEITNEIQIFCKENSVEIIGMIPFDSLVEKAINESTPVVCFADSPAGKEIKKMWQKLNLNKNNKGGILK